MLLNFNRTKVVIMFLNYIWLSFIDILKRFKICRVARSMKLNLCIPNWERFPLLSLFPQLPPFQGEEGDPLKAKAANLVAAVPWGIKAPSFQVKKPRTRSALAVPSFVSVSNSICNLLNICCFC